MKIIYLFIFLIIPIFLYCFYFKKEHFETKLSDKYILVIPSDNEKCNKYIFYNNKYSCIESDNKKCSWCTKKNKELNSVVKNNYNNNYDKIKIEKINDFTYKIKLNGNKNHTYILKKKDYKKFILYHNNNPTYDIYHNLMNHNEIITIRDLNFKKYAIITQDSNVYDNNYNKTAHKYIYRVLDEKFENNEILGFSIFKLIKEITRDLY